VDLGRRDYYFWGVLGLGMKGEIQNVNIQLQNLKVKFISLYAAVVLDAISGLGARLYLA
jgi:hypothetical protein